MRFDKEKSVLIQAGKNASRIFIRYYGKTQKIKQKDNKSLVSQADLAVNKIIVNTIKKAFPNHNIMTEESKFDDQNSDFTWIIDPIDGTHNFVRNIPICGISVALKYKKDIVLGHIIMPAMNINAIAQKGKGAFVNGKRIKVSAKKELDNCVVVYELSYNKRHEKIENLKSFSGKPIDLRNFGAAIYHLLLVATGKADAFVIFSTNPWDVAAGFVLVEEAGGKISGIRGKSYSLSDTKFLISNGRLHGQLLNLLLR